MGILTVAATIYDALRVVFGVVSSTDDLLPARVILVVVPCTVAVSVLESKSSGCCYLLRVGPCLSDSIHILNI